MMSEKLFFHLLYAWITLAVVIFLILLKVTVPYGRHTRNTWGPMVKNRLGWFLMELPVAFIFSWFFFHGKAPKTAPVYVFYGLFMLHYFNRIFIFPFRLHDNGKQMPWLIVLLALFFNFSNGFFNGYWFGTLKPDYPVSWFTSWQFITGIVLFFIGMFINITSDQKLFSLRKGGKKGYYIPHGGLFEKVSSPNLLGEIIEWSGWALMSWCLPAFSFALWTAANLIPRALDHHRWYHRYFPDYPKNRKALIPGIFITNKQKTTIMNKFSLFIVLLLFAGCHSATQSPAKTGDEKPLQLTRNEAEKLVKLPLKCIHQEYPNKPGEVLTSDKDLKPPREVHPCFYGCFDWHSSVHGHWSLVKLLKQFPNLKEADTIKAVLQQQLSKENILHEAAYFQPKLNHLYERTYGWAWLLKLAAELHTWHTPLGRKLETNLKPLTDTIVALYKNYLPRLHYPIRIGTHTNTAFGLSFAMDYARAVHDTAFENLIRRRAKDFYLKDSAYPLRWEPSGYDFLSPGMEEMDIMRKVLPEDSFKNWLKKFLPELMNKNFTWTPGIVSDRKDGTLVHLDGLNFSRAWCLYGLAKQYPEFNYLIPVANRHIRFSLPNLMGDSYMGGHWLASFAIYALSQ